MKPCTVRPPARPLARRYQIFGIVGLLGYLVLSQIALRLPHGLLHTALLALSGAFFFGELVCVGLLVNLKFDEFQRVLLVRSFLWATVITMGLCCIWGFAELGSHGALTHFPLVMLPVVLLVLTALTKVLIFRRHRSPVE